MVLQRFQGELKLIGGRQEEGGGGRDHATKRNEDYARGRAGPQQSIADDLNDEIPW